MGGGSSIRHQHHHVEPGAGPASSQAPGATPPAPVTAPTAIGEGDLPRPGLSATRRAATAVLDALGEDHDRSRQAQQHDSPAALGEDTVSYLEDPAAFQHAYRQARERLDRGEPAVELMTQDATGGLGAREGGRGFGVELEFDFPPSTDSRSSLRAIAEELHTAGLSRHTRMVGYHSGRGSGYSDARNAWRLESDCTVAGEIVSPILYDTPETWQDLAAVCDIVRRHGGVVSRRTGGHVHVSAHNYDHEVGNHNRLLQLAEGYQDTLFRLAANPERGRHRGMNWCTPNTVPAQGYRDVGHARGHNGSHSQAINMAAMFGGARDHVEFRMWDGSLDPGVIQAQVKLSLGLTEAAFRSAATWEQPNEGQADRIGRHHRDYGGRGRGARLRGEEWQESTRSFRSLVDSIFHRDSDKAQATALFAVTRWQR